MLEYISRYIVMPSWIDMTAAMVAEKYSGKDVATVHLEQVHFQAPIKVGEHVKVTARLLEVGTTSMIIEVEVESENVKTSTLRKATKARLTFVALDKDMKPTSVC